MPGQPIADIRNSFGAAFVGLIALGLDNGADMVLLLVISPWHRMQQLIRPRNYRNRDSKLLKFFVAFITFMDALHTIMCTYAIYWYLILNFGNVESLMDNMWAMSLQVIFSIIVSSSVQFYYARRVYVVSRSIILPILIVVVVVVGCGAGLYLTAMAFTLKRFSDVHTSVWPSYVALGAVALADGLVAASMCWSLYRRKTGFAKTDSIILTLMAYSINSGLLTGILGITATICFIILPTTMVWLAFSWAMSKCYVNSLLAMLNSRDYVRDRSDSGNPDNAYHLSSIRVGQLSASEAAVCVSVHRTTTLDYGRNKSDHDDEATFEVTKPNATIVPLNCKAQTPESSA
ncbi:hypothetical protein EDB85DRAFT_2142733 [Lactarius pseudohatsudake]|nr:hypothetical protein EDB85DRAFT_2142733 [Lactarius pseudohatsudake]